MDIDFGAGEVIVRNGKGAKDRVTMLPQSLLDPLKLQLTRVRAAHDVELAAGRGDVELPFALARKYPRAAFAWCWQYVFPASGLSTLRAQLNGTPSVVDDRLDLAGAG